MLLNLLILQNENVKVCNFFYSFTKIEVIKNSRVEVESRLLIVSCQIIRVPKSIFNEVNEKVK